MNRGMSELNNIEIRLISRLERKSEEEISNLMDEVYNECCMIEKIDYLEGYGFGSEGIKEYILTMLLLDIIEEDDEKYLTGSIRLLIKGIWGCLDYAKVMRYVSREKLGISSEVWHRVLDLVEERFPNLLENELAIKKTKEPIYTDVGIVEKISVLENFQEDESFEDRIDKIIEENDMEDKDLTEKKNRITENKPTKTEEEKMEYDDEQISLVNYHINNEETNKKSKLVIVIGILIALLLMFLWINGLSSKSKEEEKPVKHTINTNNNSDDNKSDEDNASTTDVNKNNSNESNESDDSIDKSLKSYDKVNYDTATKYYCLYSQAFVYEKGAKEVSENIKAQNIYSKVVNEDNCYKVRIGSAYNLEDTNKIKEELKKKSIHTYILAYDMEVEDKIREIKTLADSGDLESYKAKYVKLRNEIKGKSYYGRYVDQIDYIYRNKE